MKDTGPGMPGQYKTVLPGTPAAGMEGITFAIEAKADADAVKEVSSDGLC